MTAVFSSPTRSPGAVARLRDVALSRPTLVAFLVTVALVAARMPGTVDSDVAWQLWVAGRLNDGAGLYRDIIEVNPPLWFWMAMPVEAVARLLHLRPEPVLVCAIGALVFLALAATNRLLSFVAPSRRALLLAYGAILLLGLPWVHIGQREQIALIATVPYAALIASRRAGRPVPTALAVFIGVGGALGFALKHYFLLVPAALELWLIGAQSRSWQWRRPETLALTLTGLAYLAAVLVRTPEFFTDIVPLVRLSYGVLGAPTFAALFGPFAVVGLVILAAAALQALPSGRDDHRFGTALLVASAAFGAIYFIQAKGWIYHAIPMLGCAALSVAAFLAESRRTCRWLPLAAPALLLLPLALAFGEQRDWRPGPDLTQAVAGLRPGDSVAFLSVETAVPWSVTLQHGFRFPSRYMGFWMLNAVVRNEKSPHPDPRLTALGRQIVSETVADFRCTPPRRIIAARPLPGQPGFDTLAFFQRDPRFAELLSHYKAGERVTLQRFDLVHPWAQPPASSCRKGV